MRCVPYAQKLLELSVTSNITCTPYALICMHVWRSYVWYKLWVWKLCKANTLLFSVVQSQYRTLKILSPYQLSSKYKLNKSFFYHLFYQLKKERNICLYGQRVKLVVTAWFKCVYAPTFSIVFFCRFVLTCTSRKMIGMFSKLNRLETSMVINVKWSIRGLKGLKIQPT
jgi:hypothetical protein